MLSKDGGKSTLWQTDTVFRVENSFKLYSVYKTKCEPPPPFRFWSLLQFRHPVDIYLPRETHFIANRYTHKHTGARAFSYA